MSFEIDWASLIVGSTFTLFALFYFVCEGNFPSTSPWGGLYLEGRFNGGFFCVTGLGGLIFGGTYTRRGLFSEFYGKFFNLTSCLSSTSVNRKVFFAEYQLY